MLRNETAGGVALPPQTGVMGLTLEVGVARGRGAKGLAGWWLMWVLPRSTPGQFEASRKAKQNRLVK